MAVAASGWMWGARVAGAAGAARAARAAWAAGLQGLVRLRLDGLGLEGLATRAEGGLAGGVGLESRECWPGTGIIGCWGPRAAELAPWGCGDEAVRQDSGSLLGHHGNDLVVQPSTHGFVTIGRVLVRNKESGHHQLH